MIEAVPGFKDGCFAVWCHPRSQQVYHSTHAALRVPAVVQLHPDHAALYVLLDLQASVGGVAAGGTAVETQQADSAAWLLVLLLMSVLLMLLVTRAAWDGCLGVNG